MERYTYERLPRPGHALGDIRLVTLRKGGFDDDIRVSIRTQPLQDRASAKQDKDEDTDVWHALSYTWGNDDILEDIVVESSDDQRSQTEEPQRNRLLSVTPNLVDALRHLRSTDTDSQLWIDAICIDQSTDPDALRERARQVTRMHYVYAYADGVIIWLGQQADGSSSAMDALRTLGSSIEVDWTSYHLRTLNSDVSSLLAPWKDIQLQNALGSLLSRQWFDRLWIRQEAFMAKEATSVLTCGQSVVSFDDFRKAIFFLNRYLTDGIAGVQYRIWLAVTIFQRSFSDVANVMARIRPTDCKDARDKIYGVLGIIITHSDVRLGGSIIIDYDSSNTVEKTFTNFAQKYIERFGNLRLLHSAGLGQSETMRPTWVPDWRVKRHVELDLSMEAATSHCIRAEYEYLPSGELKVLGCHAVRVQMVYQWSELKSVQAKTRDLEFFQELLELMTKCAKNHEKANPAERIARLLSGTLLGTTIEMEQIEEHRIAIHEYVDYLFGTSPDQKPPTAKNFLSEQALASLNYAILFLKTGGLPLIFCKGGYIGLGPKGSRPDDRVYAVLGCRALLVLRATDDGKFQLVGPCSIHDLNWGEALLGPLPDGCTVVRRYEPKRQGYLPYYFDERSKIASMWDPRIVWAELEAHPPMLDFYQVAAPPEEPLRIMPGSEYLREHGVKLENIALV